MDKLEHLAFLLQAWAEEHKLPDLDAEVLMVLPDITKQEKHWLYSFMVLWDATSQECP